MPQQSVDSNSKLMFNADGSQVYVSGDATDTIYKFNLTTFLGHNQQYNNGMV